MVAVQILLDIVGWICNCTSSIDLVIEMKNPCVTLQINMAYYSVTMLRNAKKNCKFSHA